MRCCCLCRRGSGHQARRVRQGNRRAPRSTRPSGTAIEAAKLSASRRFGTEQLEELFAATGGRQGGSYGQSDPDAESGHDSGERSRLALGLAILLCVLGGAIGAVLFMMEQSSAAEAQEAQFASVTALLESRLQSAASSNLRDLETLAALFTASCDAQARHGQPADLPAYHTPGHPYVRPAAFDSFGGRLRGSGDRFVMLGYVPKITDDGRRRELEQDVSTHYGIHNSRVWTLEVDADTQTASSVGVTPYGGAEPVFPLAHLAPFEDNELGLLMDQKSGWTPSDPNRENIVMAEAARTGEPRATPPRAYPVERGLDVLAQNNPSPWPTVVVVFYPLYTCNLSVASAKPSVSAPVGEEHHSPDLAGFVTGVYRTEYVAEVALREVVAATPGVWVSVTSTTTEQTNNKVRSIWIGNPVAPDSTERPETCTRSFSSVVDFAGSHVLLEVLELEPAVTPLEARQPWVVLIGPIVFAAIAAGLVLYGAAQQRRRASDVARVALEATDRTHQYVVSYVCHELRNPLHACMAYVDLALAALGDHQEGLAGTPSSECPRRGADAGTVGTGCSAADNASARRAQFVAQRAATPSRGGGSMPTPASQPVFWPGTPTLADSAKSVASAAGAAPVASAASCGKGAGPASSAGPADHGASSAVTEALADLSVAAAAATQMAQVLDDVIDIRRLASGDLTVSPALVGNVADTLRDLANQYRFLVDPSVELRLDTTHASVPGYLDRSRLRQVVGNGLHNAAKCTTRGVIAVVGKVVQVPSASVRVQVPGRVTAPGELELPAASVEHGAASHDPGGGSGGGGDGVATTSLDSALRNETDPQPGQWLLCQVVSAAETELPASVVEWDATLRGPGCRAPLQVREALADPILPAGADGLGSAHLGAVPGDPAMSLHTSAPATPWASSRRALHRLTSTPRHSASAMVRVGLGSASSKGYGAGSGAGAGAGGGPSPALSQSSDRATTVATRVVAQHLRHKAGTGLGLKLCARVVRAMGGHMGIHTDVDGNVRFWVAVPVGPGRHESGPQPYKWGGNTRTRSTSAGRAAMSFDSEARQSLLVPSDASVSTWSSRVVSGARQGSSSLRGVTSPNSGGGRRAEPATAAEVAAGAAEPARGAEEHKPGPRSGPGTTVGRSASGRAAQARRGRPPMRIDVHSAEVVAVVDDEPVLRKTTERFLQKDGYRVLTFDDGVPLVANLAEAGNPDGVTIVLLDIVMRNSNGVEVCRSLRAAGLTMPIVAMTGNTGPASITVYHEVGFSAILGKPFSRKKLRQVLADLPHIHEAVPTPSELLRAL